MYVAFNCFVFFLFTMRKLITGIFPQMFNNSTWRVLAQVAGCVIVSFTLM